MEHFNLIGSECNLFKVSRCFQDDTPILRRECTGDASEIALLKFTEITMGNIPQYRKKNPKIAEIPFNSTNKYQVSVHETDDGEQAYLLVMKGKKMDEIGT